ncbi:MFS transporter [Agromyces sp. ZXT2-6]|uniref:MFS transporter n=1 Tax=Agromyces sp. ZXT2-6 TaxID=3461153 RepID=UPI004055128F
MSATLGQIGDQYGVGPEGMAALSSLPVLLLAVGAPLAPILERRFGAERAILTLAVLLVLAIALRPVAPLALFAGTIVAGAAISGLSVLMPQVIRHHLHRHAGLWSGVFSTSFGVSAALGAGLTIPLIAVAGSLPVALAVWAVPALVLVTLAAVAVRRAPRHPLALTSPLPGRVRVSPLLWQVTVFFGGQALVFFAVVGWLPTVYADRGAAPADAAALLAWLSIAGLPASLLVSVAAGRMPRQHWLVALVGIGTSAGLAGVAWAPVAFAPVVVAVLGFAQGAAFGLGVALIVLKAPGRVASFSAFAQGAGYALAATGPLALGLLHAADVPWSSSIALLMVVVAAQTAAGWAAGRRASATDPGEGGPAADSAPHDAMATAGRTP